jgi:hypothetical protein
VEFPWPGRLNILEGLICELRTGSPAAAFGFQFIKIAQIA